MKRQGQQLIKPGQKKIKLGGPDIPTSNFMSNLPFAMPKQPQKSMGPPIAGMAMPMKVAVQSSKEKLAAQKDIQKILQNPSNILYKANNLPNQFKEVLGPNILELKKYAKEKEKKEKLIQQQIKEGKVQIPVKKKEEEQEEIDMPTNVYLDDQGRTRDDKGNIIKIKRNNTSLKINISRVKEKNVQNLMKYQKIKGKDFIKDLKCFDQNLHMTSIKRREKKKNQSFHFIEKGSIIKKAEILRKQAEGDNKENDENGEPKLKDPLAAQSQMMNTGYKRVTLKVKHHDPIPDIEWWDLNLMHTTQKTYTLKEDQIQNHNKFEKMNPEEIEVQHKENLKLIDNYEPCVIHEQINNLIEHPIPFKNQYASAQNIVIPMYLTTDERKKINRRKRAELEKQKQDKIRLGLIKPPPPKVKLSNMMRVLGDEAVLDPSKIEAQVKASVADRLKSHLERNAMRKLTKEQRGEKMMRKLRRDTANETRIAVFRVENLSFGGHRFKVDKNAQQLAMCGVCIIIDKNSDPDLASVVVVEGGPKAIKFFKKLMLRRIKWDQTTRNKKKEDLSGEQKEVENQSQSIKNKCNLVWEGVVKQCNFKQWMVHDIQSENEGRRLLLEKGVEHYWDMAINYAVVEN